MEEKKISKAEARRLEAEKKARNKKILFNFICVLLCIGFIVVLVFLIDKEKNNDDNPSDDGSNALFAPVVDMSEEYSAGLTEDGKIQGIDDISDYVVLGDAPMVAYSGDYEGVVDPTGKVTQDMDYQIGVHLLDIIKFYADVNIYSDYYETMRNLYIFIYNNQYETYSKIYEENKVGGWESLYEFLGVTESQYYKLVEENAVKDSTHYLVVQALVEKYKITCTEQDMIDFCMFSDASIKSETDAKEVIQQYGLPYITQRTLEWKLMYVLAGEAEIVEGSLTDGITSQSELFDATYYENGKIRGVGDLSTYITLADYETFIDECNSGSLLLDMIVENSEITVYQEYVINKEKELIETIDFGADDEFNMSGDYSAMAESEFCYDITVQKLFSEFNLKLEDYHNDFCLAENMDPDEETLYKFMWGESWFNRRVMEFAVIEYLDDLVAGE